MTTSDHPRCQYFFPSPTTAVEICVDWCMMSALLVLCGLWGPLTPQWFIFVVLQGVDIFLLLQTLLFSMVYFWINISLFRKEPAKASLTKATFESCESCLPPTSSSYSISEKVWTLFILAFWCFFSAFLGHRSSGACDHCHLKRVWVGTFWFTTPVVWYSLRGHVVHQLESMNCFPPQICFEKLFCSRL